MKPTGDTIVCNSCGEKKALMHYFRERRYGEGHYNTRCKKCINEHTKRWKEKNYETWLDVTQRSRVKSRLAKFNMTILDFEHQNALQDNACAICFKTVAEEGKRLCVDYDFVAKRLRGLLCFACKRTVTMWERYPNNLMDNLDTPAAEYILNPPQWEAGD